MVKGIGNAVDVRFDPKGCELCTHCDDDCRSEPCASCIMYSREERFVYHPFFTYEYGTYAPMDRIINLIFKVETGCPMCGGRLSEIRTNGPEPVRHCFNCNFDFPVDTDGNAVRREEEEGGERK